MGALIVLAKKPRNATLLAESFPVILIRSLLFSVDHRSNWWVAACPTCCCSI